MCKANVSVYVYQVESVGNFARRSCDGRSYNVINYEEALKMDLAPVLVTEHR